MHESGRLVLNKDPENYHRDVEQAALSPGSMVPGIEDSPDQLLQFRTFFYREAQYHRIGVNLIQIPVNCPFMACSTQASTLAAYAHRRQPCRSQAVRTQLFQAYLKT